jgi:hypothetical protein
MDVVSVTLGLEETGFIIREEVFATIVVRASSDATEMWECRTKKNRGINVVNGW